MFKNFLLLLSASILVGSSANAGDLDGKVIIDGSSTVAPITEAVAEEFRTEARRVKVSVGVSGTGGGFKKFLKGEIDINNASRPIKSSESKKAISEKVKYVELPVAFDGIAVVVNKSNPIKALSLKQLETLWKPGDGQAKTWKDLDSKFSSEEVKLFGPGPDSGTFDFFTEKVLGKSGLSRGDYSSSEDDNVIVKGVSSDKNGLGYFGFAYYLENKTVINVLTIEGIEPNPENISSGKYPLARRVYIYVSEKSAAKPAVKRFVEFYLENAGKLAKDVGYMPLPSEEYERAKKSFADFVAGITSVAKKSK